MTFKRERSRYSTPKRYTGKISEKNSQTSMGSSKCESLQRLLLTPYRLTLSHNKISELPPAIANLENMEILNLFNNSLNEVPTSLSGMSKLRILNLGMNRLKSLPRGFGSFPILEVLDISYNMLNEDSLPENFFMLSSLR